GVLTTARLIVRLFLSVVFFFQAEDGIRDRNVTGVQTCALPIWACESARRVAMLSGLVARRAQRIAAQRLAPLDGPTGVPSSARSSRAPRMLAASGAWTMRSILSGSNDPGKTGLPRPSTPVGVPVPYSASPESHAGR